MSGSLATLVGLALRCCLLLLRREQGRDKEHRRPKPASGAPCMCQPCQWIRGIEMDGDETLGGEALPALADRINAAVAEREREAEARGFARAIRAAADKVRAATLDNEPFAASCRREILSLLPPAS